MKIEDDGTLKMEKFDKPEKMMFFCKLLEYYIFHDNKKKELLGDEKKS